jgi:hypothetical protein
MKVLCIYHGNCADGFGAAWAVRHALGAENVEFFPGVYQQEPPDVTGRDVVMVDFSYKHPVIHAMAAKARTLLILDHHKSAAEDLKDLPEPPTGPYNPDGLKSWQHECNAPAALHALFDMNRSGAMIAPNGRTFGLRSAEDGMDVSEIAKKYGGGGHKHAAGFSVKFSRSAELSEV